MMAWLGTALKSSQPNRNACCRSDRPMVRMIGADVMSAARSPAGATLPGDEVTMSLSPSRCLLEAAVAFLSPGTGRRRTVCGIDHDQARREDRKPQLALPRTEPLAYA